MSTSKCIPAQETPPDIAPARSSAGSVGPRQDAAALDKDALEAAIKAYWGDPGYTTTGIVAAIQAYVSFGAVAQAGTGRDALNAIYDALGDLNVDASGKCRWSDVANIQREVYQMAIDASPAQSSWQPVSEDDLARVLFEAEYDAESYPWEDRSPAEQLTYKTQAEAALQAFSIRRRSQVPSTHRAAPAVTFYCPSCKETSVADRDADGNCVCPACPGEAK